MRVTIIPSDGVVGVDGVFKPVAGLDALFPGVHAIQWNGIGGRVEFADGRDNEELVSAAFFSPAVDAWLAIVPPPPDFAAEKAAMLAQARELRDLIFGRLNGIQQDTDWGMTQGTIPPEVAVPQINGIMAAKDGLRGVTTYSTVLAAADGAETVAALKARYAVLVAALYAVNPYACTAFNGLDV